MKKLFFAFTLAVLAITSQAQTDYGYTYIGQRYKWLAGIFQALGLPVGDSARFQVGQHQRQGAVYMDTVNTPASPNGFYIYEDPTGGNSPFWNLQRTNAQICGNRLLTPWSVSWQGSGYNYSVHGGQPSGQGSYQIGCSFYTADSTTVTLDPSDDDKERIDVIYLDATGVHVLKGDTATVGTAQKPSLTLDQIELTFVTVGPGTTQPTITTLIVYDENTESNVTNIGTTTNADNLTNVYNGLKSINVTNVNHNDMVNMTRVLSGTWNVLGLNGLVIGIQLKPTFPNTSAANIAVSLLVGTMTVGTEVLVPVVKTNNSTYQQITIPLSSFGNLNNTNITTVRIRYSFPTNPSLVYSGFYLDYIYFVGGLTQPSSGTPPAQFTLTAMPGITVNPTNTQQEGGGWTLTNQTALTGQYYTKEGWVTLPDFAQHIGTLDGQAKSVNGASIFNDSLFLQRADTLYDGLLTKELYRKISRNDSVTNGTPGDTLLVKVNDSLLLIKSLIAGTNVTFDVGADSIVINATGGGGTVTGADEGVSLTGTNVRLFGPLATPSNLTMDRSINLRRKILHFNNSEDQTTAGGPIWQHTDRPYSPYQFISTDTLTADHIDPPTADMPVSGIFGRRTLFYNSGIYTTQKVYGHYLGKTIDWLDTMRFRTDGGDYNQAVIAEHRFKPRGTGPQRTGIHGTGNNTLPYYGAPTFLSNTILQNNDGVNTIHTYGWLVGISSYLVASENDTIERFSFYQTNNFLHSSTRVRKYYGLDFQHNLAAPQIDSSFGLWDQYGYRHYLRGKAVFGTSPGTSHAWAGTDQLKVIGNVNITDSLHLGKAHNLGSLTGVRPLVRRTSDGAVMEVESSLLTGGGGAATGEIVYMNTAYTIADDVTHIQVLTFTAANVDLTFPSAASWPGRIITVSTADAAIDLVHAAGDINDGEGNDLILQDANAVWAYISDGTDWNQIRISWENNFVASAGTGQSIIEPNFYYQQNHHRSVQRLKRFVGTGGISVTSDDVEVTIDGSGIGGGEATTIGAFQTAGTANGLSLSGTDIRLHAATDLAPGAVTTGTQTFAGTKIFNSYIQNEVGLHLKENNIGSTPATGYVWLYAKTDGSIYGRDDAGVETKLTNDAPGGSGTVNTGTANTLAYYPASNATVDDLAAITANRALISDANGLPTHSATTATELGHVSGVTSAIQTQLNAKAPLASPTFTGSVTFPADQIGIPVYARVSGSDATTTGQSLVDITGLSVALLAGATYQIEADLMVGTSAVTTGTQYGVNFSAAGATFKGSNQGMGTISADKSDRITTLNAVGAVYLTQANLTGSMRIRGILTTTTNAGNVTIKHLKVTSGTSTVYIDSYLKVTRIL